jgi:hypothetical protein
MTIEAERESTGWIPNATSFGARLILIRQRMGWGNVKEAAIECGLPPESWRQWEKGAAPRRIVEISSVVSNRTGCSYLWLLTGDGSGKAIDGGGSRATLR